MQAFEKMTLSVGTVQVLLNQWIEDVLVTEGLADAKKGKKEEIWYLRIDLTSRFMSLIEKYAWLNQPSVRSDIVLKAVKPAQFPSFCDFVSEATALLNEIKVRSVPHSAPPQPSSSESKASVPTIEPKERAAPSLKSKALPTKESEKPPKLKKSKSKNKGNKDKQRTKPAPTSMRPPIDHAAVHPSAALRVQESLPLFLFCKSLKAHRITKLNTPLKNQKRYQKRNHRLPFVLARIECVKEDCRSRFG